ncbi:MAG: hypothetical protein HeimAB125_00920 [Candidatus Heimdallarchaeota archaeon AB_125]|nr:MAG: hypothetical protein HeimAB125_00920 [Candidatus Heimdallarchaeota archaeon AB_125]
MIGLAKTTMKEIYVSIVKKELLEYFLELLSDSLRYVEFVFTYRKGKSKVSLFGERETINQSALIVKSLAKMFNQSSILNSDGFYVHNLKLIQQIGSKIISLQSISTVLNHLDVQSTVKDQDLVSKASMQEVQKILSSMHDLIQETPLGVRTQVMKRILATVSYCTNLSPSFVLDKGLELEYFKQQKNTISINYNPEKSIRELVEKLSKESTQTEYLSSRDKDAELERVLFRE